MGKHERQEIENAEKIVVNLLNSNKVSPSQKKNKWYNHSVALANEIRNDFPNIQFSEHIGNLYSSREVGDIKLKLANVEDNIYLELKMSESKTGKGTLANISQDTLTSSQLFSSSQTLSWSQFREQNNFRPRILEELNKYEKYPQKLNNGTVRQQVIGKAKYLKSKFLNHFGKKRGNVSNDVCDHINTPGIGDIAEIICNIIKMARKDKLDYLSYLSQFNQNSENVKKLVMALLMGYHTEEQRRHILSMEYEKIIQLLENYSVYYTNEKYGGIRVTRDNLGEEIGDIVGKDLKIVFPEGQTNCIIKSEHIPLIRVVFHWKNKFQGIQTPCLNIFRVF